MVAVWATFEFKYRPEYLKIGTRFILCEGKCKIVGEVISIHLLRKKLI